MNLRWADYRAIKYIALKSGNFSGFILIKFPDGSENYPKDFIYLCRELGPKFSKNPKPFSLKTGHGINLAEFITGIMIKHPIKIRWIDFFFKNSKFN